MLTDKKLKIAREQFAKFIEDAKTIKQFENIFRTVNELVSMCQKETPIIQVSAPTGNFSINIGDGENIPYDNNVNLFLKPTGTIATGTIVFPVASKLREGQVITISSTQTVTALTINIQDVTAIYGAITTISAGGFATFKYSLEEDNWFRVG